MKFRKITAAIASLTLTATMFTGCGADPTETYTEQVSKIAELSGSDKGTIEINMDCDFASTDEKLTLESLLASANADMDEDTEFDLDIGVTAAWSGDKTSMDMGISDDNIISIYGDNESLCLDLSNLSGIVSEFGLDGEIATELSKLFTVIKFNYAELKGLAETISGEPMVGNESDMDAAEVKNILIATLTDEGLMNSLKSLSEKATIKEGKIEIHDISKEDLKNISDALEASVEKNGIEDLMGDIDSPTILTDEDDDSGEEKNVTIDYSLSYDDAKLDQVHEIKLVNDNGDKVTFEIKIKDSDSGLNDLSEKAKTFEEITGCSIEDYIAKLIGGFMPGMMTDDNSDMDKQNVPEDSSEDSSEGFIDPMKSSIDLENLVGPEVED